MGPGICPGIGPGAETGDGPGAIHPGPGATPGPSPSAVPAHADSAWSRAQCLHVHEIREQIRGRRVHRRERIDDKNHPGEATFGEATRAEAPRRARPRERARLRERASLEERAAPSLERPETEKPPEGLPGRCDRSRRTTRRSRGFDARSPHRVEAGAATREARRASPPPPGRSTRTSPPRRARERVAFRLPRVRAHRGGRGRTLGGYRTPSRRRSGGRDAPRETPPGNETHPRPPGRRPPRWSRRRCRRRP